MFPKDLPLDDSGLLGLCDVCDSMREYSISIICSAVFCKKSYESLRDLQSGRSSKVGVNRSLQRKKPSLTVAQTSIWQNFKYGKDQSKYPGELEIIEVASEAWRKRVAEILSLRCGGPRLHSLSSLIPVVADAWVRSTNVRTYFHKYPQ